MPLLPVNLINSTVWKNWKRHNTTLSESDDEEDLSVLGVVIFLIKWLWGVMIAVLSLIPNWILILIAVVLFVRYLLKPLSK